MGIKRGNLYCNSCGSSTASVQKIRTEKNDVDIFAVVCPHCEARGYHAGSATATRTKEQNNANAQDKAATFWAHVNGEA